jgi:hypothetical protein
LDPGRYHLGDGAYTHTTDYSVVHGHLLTGTHLGLSFRLSAPTTVAVRIDRQWGVGGVRNTPHNNIVYLDGWRVGRIVPGARGIWTSAGRGLRAGRHRVKIVSEGPGDHDDFVLEGLSVVTSDPVGVEVEGAAEIWTERRPARPPSALGASHADISAWIQKTASSWDDLRRRRQIEEKRPILAAVGGPARALDPAGAIRRLGMDYDPSLVFQPGDPPRYEENAAALRLRTLRLDSPEPLRAGGVPPVVVLECEVDEVFVARSARPSVHWRWVRAGLQDASSGGGPMSLTPIDRTNPTFRFRLPASPPASGSWTLKLTVKVGEFGVSGGVLAHVDP